MSANPVLKFTETWKGISQATASGTSLTLRKPLGKISLALLAYPLLPSCFHCQAAASVRGELSRLRADADKQLQELRARSGARATHAAAAAAAAAQHSVAVERCIGGLRAMVCCAMCWILFSAMSVHRQF
jgi:hypothetical protein